MTLVKSLLFSEPQFPFQFNEWVEETGQGPSSKILNGPQAEPEEKKAKARQEAGGGVDLQRPWVAPRAVTFSPGVFTLWPCPERIPKRARPGILFPSKAPMEEESPLLEGRRGGRGARAGPPFSMVEIFLK